MLLTTLLCLPLLVLNLGLYVLGQILVSWIYRPQNLKRKYEAQWALVTGGSSGIGKALAWKLAQQGLNLVLVAMPDKSLDDTTEELRSAFSAIAVRKVMSFLCFLKRRRHQVGVNLSGEEYLGDIDRATADIDVQLLFCNAGYLVTGFFHATTLKQQMDNLNCNVTSAVAITHHFLSKMISKRLKGCIVITSSPAALMPGPFSVLYAATKSFLSSFGASIASEIKSRGIDVLVFHPSPIASRFYENQKHIDMLEFFKGFAQRPETLPDHVFSCIGRTVWADFGWTAIGFRVVSKLIDFNALITCLTRIAHLMPDYKRHDRRD